MNRSHPTPNLLLLLALVAGAFSAVLLSRSRRLPAVESAFEESTLPLLPAPYLDQEFCRDSLCAPGGWQAWIILEPDSILQEAELEMVRETLLTSIRALDEAGFDGRSLLSGYRFRRYHGEYVDGDPGSIGRLYHETQEVVLADTAFMRLWGFYLYHEIGHIVDRRLGSEPRRRFHRAIGSTRNDKDQQTADGYWMNDHARSDHGEAAADAIALWIVMRYTDNPRPVYWLMPNDTDYEQIAGQMEAVLLEIARGQ